MKIRKESIAEKVGASFANSENNRLQFRESNNTHRDHILSKKKTEEREEGELES